VYSLHKLSAYFSTCCILNIPHRFLYGVFHWTKSKQVRQQTCKTQVLPHGLKQRRPAPVPIAQRASCVIPNPLTSLGAHRRRCHPSPARKCARPPVRQAAAAWACSQRIPFARTRVGVGSAKRVFCSWWPWPLTFDLHNGRRPVRIVVEHARKISRPYLFPPLRNP